MGVELGVKECFMKNKNLLVLGIVLLCIMFCACTKKYEIGDTGPGGGIVFQISEDGTNGYEVSEVLGEESWKNAKEICEKYDGGGYSDWFLPSSEELRLVYQNLVRSRRISDTTLHWTSNNRYDSTYMFRCLDFSNGETDYYNESFPKSVRAIRAF